MGKKYLKKDQRTEYHKEFKTGRNQLLRSIRKEPAER